MIAWRQPGKSPHFMHTVIICMLDARGFSSMKYIWVWSYPWCCWNNDPEFREWIIYIQKYCTAAITIFVTYCLIKCGALSNKRNSSLCIFEVSFLVSLLMLLSTVTAKYHMITRKSTWMTSIRKWHENVEGEDKTYIWWLLLYLHNQGHNFWCEQLLPF